MRRLAALLLVAPIAGCDNGVDLHDVSAQEVGKAVNRIARQQPGRWQTSTELVAMDPGPGAGPAALAELRGQIGRKQTSTGCLTPEQASTPGFGDLRGGSCLFDRFVLKGGQLEAAMHCTRPDARVSVVQRGSYTSTAYDMRSTLSQAGPRATSSVTIRIMGRRIGACAG